MHNPSKFISFQEDISKYPLPDKFTYPFYYQPHPLAVLASKELQTIIKNKNWEHNFGLAQNVKGLEIGKMFGVLVVKNTAGELGYLAAFSGKLANTNHHKYFVPPVFDMLTDGSFFLEGEEKINAINTRISEIEENTSFQKLNAELTNLKNTCAIEEEQFREKMRKAKAERKSKRSEGQKNLNLKEYESLKVSLAKESVAYKNSLNDLKKKNQQAISKIEKQLTTYNTELQQLLSKRKQDSSTLQAKLFKAYTFLNAKGERKALLDIFQETAFKKPPAGAGECAAPKLLHYAFKNRLKPIAMAEFWWGAPPGTEIRKHKQYYPACLGKCKPILSHMLKGMQVDENPLLKNPGANKTIKTIYEDEFILVVNKPHDLLSVPGKEIYDSVYARIKKQYPDAKGPLLIHRLDMSTSGLLIIAKDLESHKKLQEQFIKRKVKKSYTALLDGYLKTTEGIIDLPLAMDVLDRPRQKVDFENGKSARTTYKVIERKKGKTRIELTPVTGRTHQLRVHCAHSKGLNMPILGDDLYGNLADRLYLHATTLEIVHPQHNTTLFFEAPPSF
ncbi:RNA pseudouridine synthase [Brumimicrobium salinarum]|uniref:RNA pseudouridine synthase n=1 Tax=Brumimicrobium salinarum TaxID=2058658 RepID=A0A2I0R4S7_9FLAO|nr:RluA family pseudouridine synthase [Brumimicrobium salinarum]PKR81577.1 RNA pseudouridine synthase [Brumimicrobium salinarum]